MTFPVSAEEWASAETYFSDNPHAIKLKKTSPSHHAFIKFENGEILALAREKEPQEGVIGEGHFSTVKKAINKRGQIFAVKILGRKTKFEPYFNFDAWRKVKGFISSVWRQLTNNQSSTETKSQRKLYLLTEFIDGAPLSFYIEEQFFSSKKYTSCTLLIAIECCIELYHLHQSRTIHRDIKSNNIMLSIVNQQIVVKFIDFDFSLILPEGVNFIEIQNAMICKDYASPEVLEHSRFSFSSDIYSLGKIFAELNLIDIASMMTAFSPQDRSTLPTIIFTLMEKFFKSNFPISPQASSTLNRAVNIIKPQYQTIFKECVSWEILFEHFRKNAFIEVLSLFAIPSKKNNPGDYINITKCFINSASALSAIEHFHPQPHGDYQQESVSVALQKLTLTHPALTTCPSK